MAFPLRSTSSGARRVVFLSSFVPRECGIATFTEDVLRAVTPHGITSKVIAMNRPRQTFTYDQRVVSTIQEDRVRDYLAAAEIINGGGFDVLSVQHEFGIYGGEECDHLLALLDAVEIPTVTTLHTVLRYPSPTMRRNLRDVARRTDAIVVMNSLAVELLQDIYEVDPRKIVVIHHGAPETAKARRYTMKTELNLRGRKVISTFGLLSSGKGLEYAIQAMPRIVKVHPDAIYLILGQTHPVVKAQEGEEYRESLLDLAARLGVAEHVRFVDKYFTKAELIAYLMATDIYLTPYLNMEQVTSGTLAYAMACGRPLVSTPYLYAQFLLADERGLLVPARDAVSIANACVKIFSDPDLKTKMERLNWQFGRTMTWPRVGKAYLELFRHVGGLRAAPTPSLQARV